MARKAASKRPNLLIVIVDNQWAGTLGCYGNTEHRTPHLDRLARQGMRFSNGYCTNGLCSPTRASVLTGLMPSQHGVHEPFNDDLSYLPEEWTAVREFRTLPLTLKNRGYNTALVGKWHLGQFSKPALGFEHWVTFPKGHTTDFYHNHVIDNGKEYDVNDRHLVDFWAEKAADYLDGYDDEKPFFLYVGFNGPYTMSPTAFGPDHRNPFYKDYEDCDFKPLQEHIHEKLLAFITQPYDPDASPELDATDSMGMLKALNAEVFDYVRMHNDPSSRANIAAQNAMVDHGVGVIMEALRRNKLEEDTLVLYLSDHGLPYGHHGWWTAGLGFPQVMYDQNVNIPFIMRHTGSIEANRVPDLMVSEVDVFPTILDYLGFADVEIADSPGRSFAPLLRGEPLAGWEQEVFFEHEETRCIRTPQYSYWKRLEGMETDNELYDLVNDPGMYENVYGKRGYGKITAELDRKVVSFFEQYSTPRYDLWKGGRPKLITYRPFKWPQKWGADWAVDTELNPEFEEDSL
jgi:arylsulfatase A-like enzyme